MSRTLVRRGLPILFLLLVVWSGSIGLVNTSHEEGVYGEEVWVDPTKMRWVQTQGPPGGKIVQFLQNPQHHNELYALSDHGDVYASNDRGETWTRRVELQNITVSRLAVYEETVFVCGNGCIFQYDHGGPLHPLLMGSWSDLFVSDGTLFAVRHGDRASVGILCVDLPSETYDWRDVSPSASELTALTLPPEDTEFWYGLVVKHLVSLGDSLLANIVMEVEGSGDYTNGCLYRSVDGGGSWSPVPLNVREGLIISTIVQDPGNKDHLIVAFKHRLHDTFLPLSEFLLESYDRGFTWSPITTLTLEANQVGDIDILDTSYYITLAKGAFILKLNETDYELIEMPRVEGYDPTLVFTLIELVFDLDDPLTVYGRTNDLWSLGLVKSEDGMQTWRKIDGDIIASPVSIVVPHPSNPDVIFTSGNTAHEAYFTTDGGATWQPFSPVTFGDELRIDPHDPNHVLFVDENSQIYASFDRGATWTHINGDFSSARVFDFEVAEDGTVYVSNTGVGLSKQVSRDSEWQYLLSSPDYVYDFAIDPDDSEVLYAACSPKLFENSSSIWRYSPNSTEPNGWRELVRFEDTRGITSLRFDPSNPDRMYAAVIGARGAIYVSDDRGDTWSLLNDQFIMNTIWGQPQLIVDPEDPSTVYVATWLAGTWKTTDAGATSLPGTCRLTPAQRRKARVKFAESV